MNLPFRLLLLQFAGFLIQTSPIAALVWVPFSSRELRFSRRSIHLILICGILLFSLGFPLLTCALYRPEEYGLMQTAESLYTLLALASGILLFWMCVHSSREKKLLVLILLIQYAACSYTLANVIIGELQDQNAHQIGIAYSGVSVPVFLVIGLCTVPVIWQFLKKMVQPLLEMVPASTLRTGCVYMALTLILFSVSIYALTSYDFYFGLSGNLILLYVSCLVLLVAIIYLMYFSEVRTLYSRTLLEQQLLFLDQQYDRFSGAIEEARRLRHDLHHHMEIIRRLNVHPRNEKVEDYMKSLEEEAGSVENMVLTPWPVLSAILSFYAQQAQENDTEITYNLRVPDLSGSVESADLTVLLANLLENALEACVKTAENRFIRLRMDFREQSLLILLENSCASSGGIQETFQDESAIQTSKDQPGHGYGLKSVRMIVKKYGGSAEYRASQSVFTSRIVLKVPA